MSVIPLATQDDCHITAATTVIVGLPFQNCKAHFDTSGDKPVRWYEAQLLNYGLPPSRTTRPR